MKPSKRIGVPFTCLLLAGVLLLSCISCAYRISAEELSGTYTRQAVEAGDTDNDFRAAAANFAIALLQQTSQQDGTNELISPLSAMLCLAMLANGAEGETKAQMEAVLGMRTEDLNRALYALRPPSCRRSPVRSPRQIPSGSGTRSTACTSRRSSCRPTQTGTPRKSTRHRSTTPP